MDTNSDHNEPEEVHHRNIKKSRGYKEKHADKARKEIEKTVEDILVKNLPNILGTVFMKFTEIMINMMSQKGDDNTKMETVRNKMLKVFTNLFSDEQNDEDRMSQDEEDTDNLKEGTRRGRSRSRNPNKDRKRWQSRD